MRLIKLLSLVVALALVASLVGTIGVAYAQSSVSQDLAGSRPNSTLPLPTDLLWSLAAGFLSPLVGYIINKLGPQTTEHAKLIVQTVVAAVAGGIAQAVTAGGVGFNDTTLQYVLFAILTAGVGHQWWKAGGVNVLLGATPTVVRIDQAPGYVGSTTSGVR